jgi:hypothetical protein
VDYRPRGARLDDRHQDGDPCGLSLGFEAACQDVNAWIRSGAAQADIIDDLAAIWPGDAAAFPALFEPDMLHASPSGAQLGVRESSARVLELLATG